MVQHLVDTYSLYLKSKKRILQTNVKPDADEESVLSDLVVQNRRSEFVLLHPSRSLRSQS